MNHEENYYAKTIEYMNKDNCKFDKFIKSIIQPVKQSINIDNKGIIVDIGSGPGITTKLLSRELRAQRIVGIDFDRNAVQFAETNNFGENIEYFEQNISENFNEWNPSLKEIEGKVTLIFSNQVLQLIKLDLLSKTIANLSKLLSTDGCLAFSLISDYSSRERDEYKKFFAIESEEEAIGRLVTAFKDKGFSHISLGYEEIQYSIPEDMFIKYFIPVEKCFIKMRITSSYASNDKIDRVLEEIIWKQCDRKVSESGQKLVEFPDKLWKFLVTK